MPNFVFSLKADVEALAERLVKEALLPLFRKLHPEKSGWNLSLVNVAATGMVDAASEKGGVGRDIGEMFKRQDDVLKQWRVTDTSSDTEQMRQEKEVPILFEALPDRELRPCIGQFEHRGGSEDAPTASQDVDFALKDHWESEDEEMADEEMADGESYRCDECGGVMPVFAMGAHARWHAQG
jgi:DNA polymerase iota